MKVKTIAKLISGPDDFTAIAIDNTTPRKHRSALSLTVMVSLDLLSACYSSQTPRSHGTREVLTGTAASDPVSL